MRDTLRVSAVQFRIGEGPEENIRKAKALLRELDPRTDIVVLPELWTDVYRPGGATPSFAPSGAALDVVRSFCADRGIHAVAGSLPWATERGVANRSWLVDDAGCAARFYDKAHLFSPSGEAEAFVAGNAPFFFDLGGIPCAVAICYDVRFPEYMRALSLAGALVIFVPAQWPVARTSVWRTMLYSAASAGQVYVVGCNCTGESGGLSFCGESLIVSPWGDPTAFLGLEEGVLHAELPLAELHKCRRHLRLDRDRRPELYLPLWATGMGETK